MRPEPLARLFELAARELYGTIADHLLQPLDWAILRAVGLSDRCANSAASLAAYLGETEVTIAAGAIALGNVGLIDFPEDLEADGSRRLSLTAAGREALKFDPVQRIAEALAEFSSDQLKAAGVVMERIAEAARQRRSGC